MEIPPLTNTFGCPIGSPIVIEQRTGETAVLLILAIVGVAILAGFMSGNKRKR